MGVSRYWCGCRLCFYCCFFLNTLRLLQGSMVCFPELVSLTVQVIILTRQAVLLTGRVRSNFLSTSIGVHGHSPFPFPPLPSHYSHHVVPWKQKIKCNMNIGSQGSLWQNLNYFSLTSFCSLQVSFIRSNGKCSHLQYYHKNIILYNIIYFSC